MTEKQVTDRIKQTETIEWQGMTISIAFEPNWLSMEHISHLEITSVEPARAALPVTDTGYRSHFIPIGTVEGLGGPSCYVRAWLDDAAGSAEWKAFERARRQLSLF